MTRSTTFAVLAAATLAALASPASAGCGGGGSHRGGFGVSFGGGYGGGHFRHHAPVRHHAPAYHAPVYRPRPVVTQPVIAPQPVFQQQPLQRPIVQQPIVQQPAPALRQPVTPTIPAEQSALNALMAFGGQPAAAPAPQQPTHVGVWTATVNSSNRVSLQLDASGAFRWTANSGGKTSSFEGRYTVNGGQLTLIRNDNQQLAGAWTADAAGGFRFRLASNQGEGLRFVRG